MFSGQEKGLKETSWMIDELNRMIKDMAQQFSSSFKKKSPYWGDGFNKKETEFINMEKINALMKEEEARRKAKELTQKEKKNGEKTLTFYMPITETLCLRKWYNSLTMIRSFRI